MRPLSKAQHAEVKRLLDGAGGPLDAEAVVLAASKKRSPLHSRFEWDDTRAAHLHRIEMARGIMEQYRIEVRVRKNVGRKTIQVKVKCPGALSVGDGYESTRVVMRRRDTAARQIEAEWDRIVPLLGRLAALCNVNPLYGELGEWAELMAGEGTKLVKDTVAGACRRKGD